MLLGFAKEKENEELKKSAELYIDLFENAYDAIFNLDLNGNFTAVNKKTEEITGYKREELIGKSVLLILPKQFHERAIDKIAEIESGKTLGPFFIELKSKNGVKKVEITARPVKIEDKIIAIQVIARDATARDKMERELKEARDLLQIILSTIDECIVVINRDYKISKIKTNKTLDKEIIGKSCHEYLHNLANRCTQYLCPVEKVFETGKPFSTTHIHFDSESKPHIVEIEAYPLYDSSGVVMQVIKVIRDVSIKRELEQKTREAMEFLDQVIENAYDIIIVLDCEGKFKLINQAAEKITGYKREEWMGKPFAKIIAPEYLDITLDKFKKALNGREIKPFEIEILSKDSGRIALEVNARGMRQDGKISSVVCIARNIAEKKKTEQKLEEYASQLKQEISFIERLQAISEKMCSPLERIEVLKIICQSVVDTLSYKMAWIGLVDEANSEVIPVAQVGFEASYLEDKVDSLGLEPMSLAIKTGKVQRNIAPEALKLGYRYSAAIPLIVKDKVIGALNAYSENEAAFDEKEISRLQIFSRLATIAIENSRLYIELQEQSKHKCDFVNMDPCKELYRAPWRRNVG
ncbi:MAG: PAS domain S-box protein [Methanocellales archaeon]